MKPSGICVSKGIAIGRAFVYREPADAAFAAHSEDPHTEQGRLKAAVAQAKKDLEAAAKHAKDTIGAHEANIFESHIIFLNDPEIVDKALLRIEEQKLTAEKAIEDVTRETSALFAEMEDDEYLRERAADIRDIGSRLIDILTGRPHNVLRDLPDDTVLFAHDLKPSDTAQLDRSKVRGFVTESGGRTSHTAILARAMGIAAIVGSAGILDAVKTGDPVIVDSFENKILVAPDAAALRHYREQLRRIRAEKERQEQYRTVKPTGFDGRRITIAANIGSIADAKTAVQNGADGIGLFRTEFLFMDRPDMPSEDEQFRAYKEAAELMKPKPVVIRTLDIGGDKTLPYLKMPAESNPFLGLRAIRLCLRNRELFKVQLRALLRASAFGNLKIMFPMISCMGELKDATALLNECKSELLGKSIPFDAHLETGMMIEIPAAAILAGQFAKHVDFFSIGTNDLTQYTLAVDRLNETVSDLYQSSHPAVLELIKHTIRAAHEHGIPCHMCGEMAADPAAIPTLLKLGLDEFSVSPGSVLETRGHIFEAVHSCKKF